MAGKRSIFEEVSDTEPNGTEVKAGGIDARPKGARAGIRLWLVALFLLVVAMIAVGGLGEYAAGNKARLVRFDKGTGKQEEFGLRLNDLIKRGDIKANVRLQPGDVIIIPESMF